MCLNALCLKIHKCVKMQNKCQNKEYVKSIMCQNGKYVKPQKSFKYILRMCAERHMVTYARQFWPDTNFTPPIPHQ